jgi:HEAT repeat protein
MTGNIMKRILKSVLILLLLLTGVAFSRSVPKTDIDRKVDSLFVIASSGMVMFQSMVQPATDSLVAMGVKAVPRLIEKYVTQDARERQNINSILVKIGKPAVPYLVEALNLPNAEQVSRICNTLGEIKDSSSVKGLITISGHADWRVRSEAVGALGKIGDKKGDRTVIKLLSDKVEIVRKSAAVSAGLLQIKEALPILVHLLADNFYGARMCASEALVRFGAGAVKVIADSLHSVDSLVGNLGCTTLGMIGGDTVATALGLQLKSSSPVRRALAAEAVLLSNSPVACSYVEALKPHETDSTVIFFIDKVLAKYASR